MVKIRSGINVENLFLSGNYGLSGGAMYGSGGGPLGLPGMGPTGVVPNSIPQGLQRSQISNLWMTNAPGAYQRQDPSAEDEEVAAEDEDDMGVIETYSNYMPTKLKVRCKNVC